MVSSWAMVEISRTCIVHCAKLWWISRDLINNCGARLESLVERKASESFKFQGRYGFKIGLASSYSIATKFFIRVYIWNIVNGQYHFYSNFHYFPFKSWIGPTFDWQFQVFMRVPFLISSSTLSPYLSKVIEEERDYLN